MKSIEMASNNTVASSQQQQQAQQQSHQQQQFQQPNSQHHCKECGLFFDSGKSLEVHLQYHKENLLNKWATQASQSTSGSGASDETNNNNTKSNNNKREFNSHPNTIAAAADSSDAMLKSSSNKSPDSFASRTTPETSTTSFGHPPTPQSYSSAPSPYQTADGANFSPSYQNYPSVKNERASPLNHYPSYQPQQHMYPADPNQYFMDQQQHAQSQQQQLGYPQDYPVHKIPSQSAAGFRYHPYQHPAAYDRSPQVSSSSPAYPSQNPQPTPSPSPKQCDKCGCVCDSAAQLIDHLNHAHPPTPAPHLNNPFTQHPSHQQHSQQQHFQFNTLDKTEIKQEDEPQTEILDLDSHKVHQVFQSPEEEESLKRHNGELSNLNGPNPHSVSAMLNTWPNGSPQQKMFSPTGAEHRSFFPDQKMFSNGQENKMYQGNIPEKMFQQEQKLFQPHQMHSPDFGSTNGVTTTSQDGSAQVLGQYRSFEHMPPQPTPPVISSTQLPNPVPNNNPGAQSKGANWKSNEARRPKTYNCSACNKWFTSSGHLKRHYNTTLHKNAVKSSGQPDPASMPISAHHHPGREPSSRSNDTHSSNTSPDLDDVRDDAAAAAFERTQMPGMLQQPPSGPYDRQQPPPPNLHSPMGQNPAAAVNPLTNLSAGSPPNGEAGPSVTNQDHSRGLLSISTPSTPQQITPLSPMVASMSTGSNQLGFSLLNQAPHPVHMMGLPSPGPGPGELSQPGFPPPTMSQPSSMPANYPNGLAPHVMQAMVTNSQPPVLTSLTTTGEAAFTPELLQYGFQTQQLQYIDQQPLPSFAQFQPHRYGLLLAAGYPHAATPHQYQANVGGFGPVPAAVTVQAQDHHQAFLPQPLDNEPRGLIYHDTDGGNYEITVLSNENSCILPDEASNPALYSSSASSPVAATSPTHLPNNSHGIMYAAAAAEEHSQLLLQPAAITKLTKLSPASPIREEVKREYENGSPRITSTGSPLAGRTAPAGVHKCFDCDKVFNKACYLTQHNKTCHSGEMPFKCGRCGKRFQSDDTYREHLAKHAGDKPYKCEQCPKQFNHKTDLRRHMCLHTGQKPYACDHCGKGFIRKDHMLKHADTHSRKTNQAKHLQH